MKQTPDGKPPKPIKPPEPVKPSKPVKPEKPEKPEKPPKQGMGYTVIFVICMGLIAFMVFTMLSQESVKDPPIHTPHYSPDSSISEPPESHRTKAVTINETQLAEMLSAELPSDFPLNEASVALSDGMICLTGKGKKDVIVDWLVKKGVVIPETVASALVLLPDDLSLAADFSVEGDKNSGLLKLTTQKLCLNDILLPSDIGGQVLPGTLATAINNSVCESGMYFTKIVITEGQMELISAPLT